jgi:hypothetical protein
VDTRCFRQLGQPLQLAYQGAVKWLFGIDVDKEHTRSNWLKRPLQQGQLHYAAMDVVLLPRMLAELRPRLEQAGRWSWLQEEVTRMQRNAAQPTDPDQAYLRIGGAAAWTAKACGSQGLAAGVSRPRAPAHAASCPRWICWNWRACGRTRWQNCAPLQMHPNALGRMHC